jgi:pSer/pThr/pTyr-binding forkhead associated (FHA) protein
LVVTPATEPTTPPQLRVNIVGRYLGATTEDGCVATEHDEPLVIGRRPGSPFADDPYVERCHASLTATPEGVRVEDFGSLNGVYVRLTTPARLGDGDLFRVGHELLSFETLHAATVRRSSTQPLGCPDPGYWARISAMLTPECSAASYPVDDVEVVIGRGDTHLQFPDDDFVDAAHCRVTADDHGAVLEDLDSAHGTFLRLRSGDVVPYDSVLLVGQTLVSVGVHRAK